MNNNYQDNSREDKRRISKSSQTSETSHGFKAHFAPHCTMLHEHHDFFLASQHTSSFREACEIFPTQYTQKTSLWKHGNHDFLELLGHVSLESFPIISVLIRVRNQAAQLSLYRKASSSEASRKCLGHLVQPGESISEDDLEATPRCDEAVWNSGHLVGNMTTRPHAKYLSPEAPWIAWPADPDNHAAVWSCCVPFSGSSLDMYQSVKILQMPSKDRSQRTLYTPAIFSPDLPRPMQTFRAFAPWTNATLQLCYWSPPTVYEHVGPISGLPKVAHQPNCLRDTATRLLLSTTGDFIHLGSVVNDGDPSRMIDSLPPSAEESTSFGSARPFLRAKSLTPSLTDSDELNALRQQRLSSSFDPGGCSNFDINLGACHDRLSARSVICIDPSPRHRQGLRVPRRYRINTFLLVVLLLLALTSPATCVPSTPTTHGSATIWYGSPRSNTGQQAATALGAGGILACSCFRAVRRRLLPDRLVLCGFLLVASALAWVGCEFHKPATTPVTQTLHNMKDLTILILALFFALTFSAVHCVRLGHASRYHQGHSSVYHSAAPSSPNQYVLRVLTCVLFGTSMLLGSFGETLTPHLVLVSEPALLSGSIILNASFEGRESPVDVEAGGGS